MGRVVAGKVEQGPAVVGYFPNGAAAVAPEKLVPALNAVRRGYVVTSAAQLHGVKPERLSNFIYRAGLRSADLRAGPEWQVDTGSMDRRRAEVRAGLEAGEKLTEIADRLGLAVHCLHKMRHDFPAALWRQGFHPRRVPVRAFDLDRARNLAKAGLSMAALAREMGVSKWIVTQRRALIWPDGVPMADQAAHAEKSVPAALPQPAPAPVVTAPDAVVLPRLRVMPKTAPAPRGAEPSALVPKGAALDALLETGGRLAALDSWAKAQGLTRAQALGRWHLVRHMVPVPVNMTGTLDQRGAA